MSRACARPDVPSFGIAIMPKILDRYGSSDAAARGRDPADEEARVRRPHCR